MTTLSGIKVYANVSVDVNVAADVKVYAACTLRVEVNVNLDRSAMSNKPTLHLEKRSL